MKRKLLSMLLAVAMIAAMLPAGLVLAEDFALQGTGSFKDLLNLDFENGFELSADGKQLTVFGAVYDGSDYVTAFNAEKKLNRIENLGSNNSVAMGIGNSSTYLDFPEKIMSGTTVMELDLYVKPGNEYTYTKNDTLNRFLAFRLHPATGAGADYNKALFDIRLDYTSYETDGKIMLGMAYTTDDTAKAEVTGGTWLKTRTIVFNEVLNDAGHRKIIFQYKPENETDWITLNEVYGKLQSENGIGQFDFRKGGAISAAGDLAVIDNLKIYTVESPPTLVWDGEIVSSDLTDHSITLNWTAPAQNEFGVQRNYDIYEISPEEKFLGSISDTSFVVNELAESTPYQFKVVAKNVMGGAAEKTLSVSTVSVEDTVAPTWQSADQLTVLPAYEGAVLTWPAATDADIENGKYDIITYTIKNNSGVIGTTQSTKFAVTDLLPGTVYSDFSVSCESSTQSNGTISQLNADFSTMSRPKGITTYVDASFDGFEEGLWKTGVAGNQNIDLRPYGGTNWNVQFSETAHDLSFVKGRSGSPEDVALNMKIPGSTGLSGNLDWTLPYSIPGDSIMVTEFSIKLDIMNLDQTNANTFVGLRPINGKNQNFPDMRIGTDKNGVLSTSVYGAGWGDGFNLDQMAQAQGVPGGKYEWLDMRLIYDRVNHKLTFMFKTDNNEWTIKEGSYGNTITSPIKQFQMFVRSQKGGEITLDNFKIYTIEDTTPISLESVVVDKTANSATLTPSISGSANKVAYYVYSYKLATETEYISVKSDKPSYTFTGLTRGSEYDYKVQAFGLNYTTSAEKTGMVIPNDPPGVDTVEPYVVVTPSEYVLEAGATPNWSKTPAAVTITGMDDGSGVASMLVNGTPVVADTTINGPYYKLEYNQPYSTKFGALAVDIKMKGGTLLSGVYALKFDPSQVEMQYLYTNPDTLDETIQAVTDETRLGGNVIFTTKAYPGIKYADKKPAGDTAGSTNIDLNKGLFFFEWYYENSIPEAEENEVTLGTLFFQLKDGTVDTLDKNAFTSMTKEEYLSLKPGLVYGNTLSLKADGPLTYSQFPDGSSSAPSDKMITSVYKYGNVDEGADKVYQFKSSAPIDEKTDFAVVVTDNEGNKYEKTWTAYIDAQAPSISNLTLTPAAGQITAAVTAADTGGSGVKNYTYTLKKNTTPVGEPIVKTSSEAAVFTGLDDETEYEVTVVVSDNAGNTATKTEKATTLQDDIAPTWPASSAITAESSYNYTTDKWDVTIEWTPAEDNKEVTKYEVYLDNVKKAEVLGTITSYQFTGIDTETACAFKVIAFDAAGNFTESSLEKNDYTTGAKPEAYMEVSVGLVHHVKLGTKDAMQMKVTIAANEKSSEIALGSDMETTQPISILDGAGSIAAAINPNATNSEYVDSFVLTGTMNPGTYKITITGAGYMTYEETITIADQETGKVDVTNKIDGGFAAGDILGTDKQIDLNDLSAIAGNFNAAEKYTSPEMVQFDLNRDGFIDITDIVYVIRNFSSRAQ